MEKREDALRDAIAKNAEEKERWESFVKENETAIENLGLFGKRLSVDVMVPLGRKAYIPGQLIHTNEVLVGHYQGYFSKCSAHKAQEICELRLKMAKEHLEKLQTEAELWQNKLEKPYAEGVMPSSDEREIIEDYDVEKEKRWREEHKRKVKKAKLQEKARREAEEAVAAKGPTEAVSEEKSDEEIFKMLEEAELMEELEQELDKLEVDEVNDETIRKLMSGEMKLPPPKPRVAHNKKEPVDGPKFVSPEKTHFHGVVKKANVADEVPPTNNNFQPNPELLLQEAKLQNGGEEEEVKDEVEESGDELPAEVQIIKEQAKFLPDADQIGFYEYQIQIIRQKLMTLPLRTQKEIDEKIRLITVLEHLEELLEIAEETVGAEELAEQEAEDSEEDERECEEDDSEGRLSTRKQQKRRISFALEDQMLEFRKNEAVTQMLPKEDPATRDIIRLDEVKPAVEANHQIEPPAVADKKESIRSKVERNLQFVADNQSEQDFDLVDKILDSAEGRTNTLHITFRHSNQIPTPQLQNEITNEPGSPADLYNNYLRDIKGRPEDVEEPTTLFVNAYEGEDQVKVPVLRESERKEAFVDPRIEFSKPGSDSSEPTKSKSRSILRNKSAVEKENHLDEANIVKKANKQRKKTKSVDEEEYLSAYYKVMKDVVEKPLTEPEPLPQGKFIDAHTPKQRISRFKQMRSKAEKT